MVVLHDVSVPASTLEAVWFAKSSYAEAEGMDAPDLQLIFILTPADLNEPPLHLGDPLKVS